MAEDTAVEQAKRDLAELTRAAREQGPKIAQQEEAIATLRQSVQTLSEAVNRSQMPTQESRPERVMVEKYTTTDAKGKTRVRAVGERDERGAWLPGLLDDERTVHDWQREIQAAANRRTLVRLLARTEGHSKQYADSPQCDAEIATLMRTAPEGFRRIFGDNTNAGAEWIPDVTLPEVDRYVKAQRRVEALFRVMPMTDKTLILPKLTVGLRAYIKGAATGDDPAQYTASSLTTDSKTITAKSLAVRLQVDDDASEDSILAVESLIRDELVSTIVDASEDAIINGDTAGTHQDTGLTGWDIRSRWGTSGLGLAADHRRAWIGLRARATDIGNTVDNSSAQTFAGVLSQRASLDSPMGLDDCVLITSPEWYLAKILGFSEVITMEKFGPQATVLTGQVANLGGMPVVISEFVDKQYTTAGIYDNSTKTKTGCLVVNRGRFFIGARRGAVVDVDRDITRGLRHWVVTVRKTFDTPDPASTKKNVSWAYNLSPS